VSRAKPGGRTTPTRVRRLAAFAVLAAIVATACGDVDAITPDASAPERVATLRHLIGAWQPEPFVLDAVWRSSIVAACRRDLQVAGGVVAVIDARGGGVATVRLTGQQAAKCDALRITPAGRVEGAGSGSGGTERIDEAPPESILAVEEATVGGGALTVTGWSVTGRVGEGVASVEVVTERYPRITASVESGWFSAWWPAAPGDPEPADGVIAPYRIRALTESGRVVEERDSTPAVP